MIIILPGSDWTIPYYHGSGGFVLPGWSSTTKKQHSVLLGSGSIVRVLIKLSVVLWFVGSPWFCCGFYGFVHYSLGICFLVIFFMDFHMRGSSVWWCGYNGTVSRHFRHCFFSSLSYGSTIVRHSAVQFY